MYETVWMYTWKTLEWWDCVSSIQHLCKIVLIEYMYAFLGYFIHSSLTNSTHIPLHVCACTRTHAHIHSLSSFLSSQLSSSSMALRHGFGLWHAHCHSFNTTDFWQGYRPYTHPPTWMGSVSLSLCHLNEKLSCMSSPASSYAAVHVAMFTTVHQFYVTFNSFLATDISSNISRRKAYVHCAYWKQNSFVLFTWLSNKTLQHNTER